MNAQAGTLASPASRLAGDGLLRVALKLDAVVTGANGLAYLAFADLLDGPLGLPVELLRPVGAFLLVFAGLVWLVASRPAVSRPAVLAVIDANALWAVASVVLVATDAFTPTTGGAVWMVLQALVVGAFAALQAMGLRREPARGAGRG
jgi:hypothetical protein